MPKLELPALDNDDIVGLDTETDGLDPYKNYAVGLGVARRNGTSFYLSWGHATGNNIEIDRARDWCHRELNRPGLVKIFHNAKFDLQMLRAAGIDIDCAGVEDTGILCPVLNELEHSFSLDSLAAKYVGVGKLNDQELLDWCALQFGGKAEHKKQVGNYWRAPGSMVSDYCCADASLTLQLYEKMRPRLDDEDLTEIYRVETQLIPILLKMNRVGVKVDKRQALVLQEEFTSLLAELEAKWREIAGDVNMRSGKQMAALLDRFGIGYERTARGNPSITGSFLERLDHPIGHLAVEIRKLHHYAGTFLQSYIFDVADDDGIIHGDFHALKSDSYGTVSGRFSSGGALNLQNIPSRDKVLGPKIRGLFVPFEDMLWAKYDYSQIEYRFLGHYGGGSIERAYNDDRDTDFHVWVSDFTGIDRKPAKNINFGLAYGMGVRLMAERLNVPESVAREMLEMYHSKLPEVRRLYEKAMRKANQRGWIRTWGGRKRRFELSKESKWGGKYNATHKALNALLQGSAADLIKKAMIRVNEVIDWKNMIMHLTVHDELDFSVDPGEKGLQMVKDVQHAMQDWPLRVPILVDVKIGPDWGHGEKFNGSSFPASLGHTFAAV